MRSPHSVKRASLDALGSCGAASGVGSKKLRRNDAEVVPVRTAEAHLAFIRKLQPGQELNLEVQNREGDAFVILELSEDQRAAVREEGGKPGELRRPKERNRPERMEREVREKDILIDVLRDEIRRLYQENAELRRQLEERDQRSEDRE